jgi:hypothetical protein
VKPRVLHSSIEDERGIRAVAEGLMAAGIALGRSDYSTRQISRPSRRLGGRADEGGGYVHDTPEASVEAFGRNDWAGGPRQEIVVRRKDHEDVFVMMPPTRHMTTRTDRRKLGEHLRYVARGVEYARAWDATAEDTAIVARFDALCELAAIEASGDGIGLKCPAVPIDCPGPFETRRSDFARRRDGAHLVVSSVFARICSRRIGPVLTIRGCREATGTSYLIDALRRYASPHERDAISVMRAIETMRLPEGTGPLVEWRIPDDRGVVI